MTETRAVYGGTAWPAAPQFLGACAVCGGGLVDDLEAARSLCWKCQEWPAPLLDAHLKADDEGRERIKVRLIAAGNNQFEFRVCRIAGDWLEVEETKHDLTFWVAKGQIVTVWEERV